jgi:hypothetical protein
MGGRRSAGNLRNGEVDAIRKRDAEIFNTKIRRTASEIEVIGGGKRRSNGQQTGR